MTLSARQVWIRLVQRNLSFEILKSQYRFCRSQQGSHIFQRSTYVSRSSERVKEKVWRNHMLPSYFTASCYASQLLSCCKNCILGTHIVVLPYLLQKHQLQSLSKHEQLQHSVWFVFFFFSVAKCLKFWQMLKSFIYEGKCMGFNVM
jgi:hypothetical protein